MVKKLKSIAGNSSDSQLGSALKDSASQIWQAGLGAIARAQEEGEKVFGALVKEGGTLQRRTKKMTEDKVSEVTSKVTRAATDLSKQANGTWDKLEQVFEERVARALSSLGVPTKRDIEALNKRLDALTGTPKAKSAAAPKKAAAKKSVARKAPAKKVAKATRAA